MEGAKCYRCENEITRSNWSYEHVILNACGGRLKSGKLLCSTCNSIFGNDFDSALAKSTNDLANFLMITRDDGEEPKPIRNNSKEDGPQYHIGLGGKPILARPSWKFYDEEGKTKISVIAKNTAELKKTLKGLKRRYPALDIENLANATREEEAYVNDTIEIQLSVGGPEVFKSITKTAINFFILNNGDRKYIKHLIAYLDGEVDLNVAWFYYPESSVYTLHGNVVTHVLKVVGDSKERILYAYVELFNVPCFIVKLSTEYDGNDMDIDYIFDVHTLAETSNVTSLKLNREELVNLLENKDLDFPQKVQQRYNRIFPIIGIIQRNHEYERIRLSAIEEVLGPDGENKDATQEQLSQMIQIIKTKLDRFHKHLSTPRKKAD